MKQKKNNSTSPFKRSIRGLSFHDKLARSKRGISSIFIAIYLALIVVILISALFVGQVISRSSLTDYLKIEQERRQENILITKILTDQTGDNITHVQVNNTGAITVRIRALYVGGELRLDPDLYIEPKEAANITLVPQITLDESALLAEWTVTTERGIRSSDLGWNLLGGGGGPIYTPNKFYFGPLMLYFDDFKWRSGTGQWNSGWAIPQGTNDVTWRINVTNVDDRLITITDPSCFTLVGNAKGQGDTASWFVNPELSSLTFVPEISKLVYYTWSKPYSDSGAQPKAAPSGLSSLEAGKPWINFLTFTGYFTERNGTQTPFGQTIPFEAVLIT